MNKLQKWWKPALAVVCIVIAFQVGVSLLVRTHRGHAYLIAHLERAFGRQVEVESFDARILPSPQLDANGVTVGEDPSFGHEYFLRAENLSANLRLMSLLRGHFEFGTMSLNKPSLILVRNSEGRWNLERWLPPAKTIPLQNARVYGPASPVAPVNRLEKIEFDDGRVNFKTGDDKLPFAFTGVSGSVEQILPGRWQLQLTAQPWRSGVSLQSAGTIKVLGDVAGTSARLQPAGITLRWSDASLADVLRLFRGQDYGVRGTFALDATAKSGAAKEDLPEDWSFSIHGRTGQIHRWDLAERTDNPRLNLKVNGRWNIGSGSLIAEELVVDGPKSNLRGQFRLIGGNAPSMELRLDSLGIQASDLLAWYRSFHPDVAEGVAAEQYFTGGMILRGWPMSLESAALSSSGGIVKVPGFPQPVRIGPLNGGRERGVLTIGPARVALGGEARDVMAPKRRRVALAMENAADLTFTHDLNTHAGSISIEGNVFKAEDFLKLSAAFGRQLNRGWELTGQATAVTRWEWKQPFAGTWNGRIGFNKANLTVAGLNQPLKISESALDWVDGRRIARLMRVEGFGGMWTGNIEEPARTNEDNGPKWNFHLRVDQLNAADLDRWVGPRARPSWLQRLLPPLLGGSAPSIPASELVRRVNAEGELDIGQLTIEKLKLEQVQARGYLHDLQLDVREAQAEWAGGKVHAKINAKFLPRPAYDISAELDRVNLAQLPGAGRIAERLGGFATGTLRVKTEGVGRDELLGKLSGRGDFHLNKVEFRGWDVNASVADGEAHAGVSRWATGEGSLCLQDSAILLEDFRLNSGWQSTLVNGTLSFGRNADLAIETVSVRKNKDRKAGDFGAGRVLKISGPLDGPKVSVEKASVRQPAD
ncbi:MAG TPA: AsmA family protein [Candidatus Polarisedimenticolia bacterium]|nr:AsmA family protein [Candidatus Polarisedimenticolia bacterium]